MSEPLYFFNGKDITMNMCIQIRDTIRIIMERDYLSLKQRPRFIVQTHM